MNQMHIVALTWVLAGSWSLSCCWFGRNQSWSEVSNGTGSLGTRCTGCFEPRDWEKADRRKRTTTTGRWWTRTSGVSQLAAPDWWRNLDAPTWLERWEVSWGGRWPGRSPSAQLERHKKPLNCVCLWNDHFSCFTWSWEARRICPLVDDGARFDRLRLIVGKSHVGVFPQRLVLHWLVSGGTGFVPIRQEAGTGGRRERRFTRVWEQGDTCCYS